MTWISEATSSVCFGPIGQQTCYPSGLVGPWSRTPFLTGGPARAQLPLVLGIGDALLRSLISFGLLGGYKGPILILLPGDELRGATSSLALRITLENMVDCAPECLGGRRKLASMPEFGGRITLLLLVHPRWLRSHLVSALSWPSSHSGLRQWMNWDVWAWTVASRYNGRG